MGAIRLNKIIPKSLPLDPEWATRMLDGELTTYAGNMVRGMALYPPALPWTSRPPRTGPRAGGRRTGGLGRNWRISQHRRAALIEVANPTDYAGFVQGPPRGRKGYRQTAVMAARGWQTITVVNQRHWPSARGRITTILKGRNPRGGGQHPGPRLPR